jgi:hypothetical protein
VRSKTLTDSKFAALAAATDSVLISNDDHLLARRDQLPVGVLKPSEFLAELTRGGADDRRWTRPLALKGNIDWTFGGAGYRHFWIHQSNALFFGTAMESDEGDAVMQGIGGAVVDVTPGGSSARPQAPWSVEQHDWAAGWVWPADLDLSAAPCNTAVNLFAPDAGSQHQNALTNHKPAGAILTRGDGIADFPIVGIESSAGGLDALQKLFGAMPPKSGFAFVVVAHLDPTHESQLAALIARCTTVPVSEVEEPVTVEPDHVYVIAPNQQLTFEGDVLRPSRPSEVARIGSGRCAERPWMMRETRAGKR